MYLSAIKKSTLLDYPGKMAAIVFTPGCNFRCRFCHNPEFVLPEEIKKLRDTFIHETVFFRFLTTRIGFLEWVVICGGEPTIHRDLPDFCHRIKTMGFFVKLDTNGSNPTMIHDLLDKKLVDYIAMDVKTPLERYREIINSPSDEDAYKKSIDVIMHRCPDYEFRTTVIKGYHTSEDIVQISQHITWAKRYFLQNYRSEHILDPNFLGTGFENEALQSFVILAQKYVQQCEIRM